MLSKVHAAALCAVLLLCARAVAQPAAGGGRTEKAQRPAPSEKRTEPWNEWEFALETGALWKITGEATPLRYVVLPQLLTWRSPAVSERPFAGGTLIMRSRFSVLIEPIVKGPESYYLAASAAGCLEWWNLARTRALFFSSGGGLGFMDSRGHEIEGAQGQDLNFNWLMYGGVRQEWSRGRTATIGLYFQHVSNTGLDDVNPGLNALGPMVSFSWKF